MSKAFILIPGARLPEGEAQRILSSLPEASARALSSLGEGAGQVVAQVLDAGCYRRAPHLSWLWRVITRRNSTPHEAPWRWLSLGGREQAPELWCLTPLSLENGHVLAERPELEEREFMELTFAIEPVFLKAGLRVQIWDTSWFLTRREDWAVTTAPAMALPGLMLDEAPVEGEAAEEVKGLLREVRAILADHPVNAARRAAGRHAVDALWISGGGHEELFFPPTLIRSVASDDAAVRGWANAAGILIERIGRDTGRWPEAPHGDVVAVIEDLYPAWLARDWEAWARALPEVARKAASYREDAKRFEADDVLVVAFGETGAATLAPAEAEASWRGDLFRRKSLWSNPKELPGALTTDDAMTRILNREFDLEAARRLHEEGYLPPVARALSARGIRDASELAQDWKSMLPPAMLEGTREAAERLALARERGERVTVVADYDCDGATACAVATEDSA